MRAAFYDPVELLPGRGKELLSFLQKTSIRAGRGLGIWRLVDKIARVVPEWQNYPTKGPDGLPFNLDFRGKGFGQLVQGWGTSEIEPTLALLPRDAIGLDVGANLGVWTRVLCRQMPLGHVYSFEPSPSTFDRLVRNVAPYSNVTCVNTALGEANGLVAFSGTRTDHGLRYMCGSQTDDTDQVVCWRLSEWCESIKLKRLDFLKVDVEGLEEEVIVPALDILTRFKPIIVFEFIAKFAEERSKYRGKILFGALREAGYRIRRLDKSGNAEDLNKTMDWTNDYIATQR